MNLKSIPILYEDTDVLVINKPAGLIVHSDGRTQEPTVVDWILKHHPEIKGVGDELKVKSEKLKVSIPEHSLDRSGIVHRLDRETSGALLIAKNQKAFWHLKKQFQKEEVQKEYHAFAYGRLKNDEGIIDRPIARSASNPVLWSATRGRRGKERNAVTEYKVLQRSSVHTFLALFPHTGRTHQIRVHLKAINYPIVCDKLYAPKRPCELGFKRLALHSRSLSFIKLDGRRMSVEAPYPADFQKALEYLKIGISNT